MDRRVGGIATIPSRIDTLQQVLDSIITQIDILYVVFNGHAKLPSWTWDKKWDKCVWIHQPYNELGDAMKFYGANRAHGIYFTFDDDLIISPNHCDVLLDGLNKYGGAVGFHGKTYPRPVVDFRSWTYSYRCLGSVLADKKIDVIGTGCLAFDVSKINVTLEDFPEKNMADIFFSKICFEQKVPMHVLSHTVGFMRHIRNETSIWRTNPLKKRETELLKEFLK